jgi:hypothetical protein
MISIRQTAAALASPHTMGEAGQWVRRASVILLLGGWMTWGCFETSPVTAAEEGEPAAATRATSAGRPKNKFREFGEVTEGAKQYDGLFKLYEVDDHVYAEIRPNQFNQMYLAPIAIARGMASAGTPLNFGDEWILSFRRVGDRIQLIRNNIHYEAPKGTPLAKAVEQNYTDSILMALPIVTINPMTQGVLIDFSSIFLSDFAGLGLGPMDRSRSAWHKIKAFENNIELEVEATFGAGRAASRSSSLDDGVVDARGVTLVLHYSLAKRPDPGYSPRFADQRVGHFISATKDFGSSDPDTTFVRRINRWRLEKANPQAKLSPPKKQIVWWVENTVPHEYRPYVEEGILEWNKAFERIGFRNAIGVRWQNDQDEFDPEDINYCTFRWITTPSTYAMSGLRADPITGEMIDGDVIFDASWIRTWKREYAFLVGAPAVDLEGRTVMDVAEIISPMMAAKYGFGLPTTPQHRQQAMHQHAHDHGLESWPELIPSDQSPLSMLLSQRLTGSQFTACQFAAGRRHEYTLAAMALAARGRQDGSDDNTATGDDEEDHQEEDEEKDKEEDEEKDKDEDAKEDKDDEGKPADDTKDKDEDDEQDKDDVKDEDEDEDEDTDEDEGKDQDKKAKDQEIKLPEELIGQAIKEVVMHEVGHSLGLRHNFKASAMLSLDEINDQEITHEKGMVGSVMDYNPLNIARKGEKQGDYATTTIGPYDYWAIEYAYKPIRGNEAGELKKIAARSPENELVYATDEDLYMSNDPLVNTYDLGNDTLRYAKERISLSQELLKGLDSSIVRDGESWSRLRQAFSVLLSQYGNAAYMATAYIGGQYFSRDFKGGDESRDPVVPVEGDKQREALKFVTDQILTDQPFEFSPELLRRLTTEHWYHWASDSMLAGNTDFDVHDRVLRIQQIVLSHCLSASVLHRLQNQQLMMAEDAKPLRIAEVLRTLTDAIWSELPNGEMPEKLEISLIRRNLQRDHLRRLCQIVVNSSGSNYANLYGYAVFLGGSGAYPADARSLARMHLHELHDRLDKVLGGSGVAMNDSARAHLQESRDMIGKVLSAQIESSVN